MPGSTRTLRNRAVLVTTLAAAVAVTAVTPAAAGATATPSTATAASTSPYTTGNYIVMLRDEPVASYEGDLRGYARTKPLVGRQLDVRGAAATKYAGLLTQRQDAALRSVGATARYRYRYTLNGFSARLTGAQAAKLASSPGVLKVAPERKLELNTVDTPRLLGLTGRTGVWRGLGGAAKAGNGVVVGVIDTGYWPESPAFAGKPVTSILPKPVGVPYRTQTGRIAMKRSDGGTFNGVCQAGTNFTANLCNSKVVGARYFADAFKANNPDGVAEDEYLSPRDGDGHGSHTASTAVGNTVANVKVQGNDYGTASGMAPGAKLSVYKVCFTAKGGDGGCYNSDSVAAIDAAVADGVDVINYSISGSPQLDDPAGYAFLHAAAAGVFVAASAGNSGPGASTLDHVEPWLTTVGATTAHRFENTVVLGNGKKYLGVSLNRKAIGPTPAVLAASAAVTGAADANYCVAGSLDPAKVKGKVVVCDRGGPNFRVQKSEEVKRAGGVAMVLVDLAPAGTSPDAHFVPTTHLDEVRGAAVKAYVGSTPNATIAFQVGNTTGSGPTPLPQPAVFSSRGPAVGVAGDLLKPDITAPGVGIIASVTPKIAEDGEFYSTLQGTSMSSPHIAGLAALILQKHPLWSPSVVKSAMMTTAVDTRNAAGKPATDPFAQGAGFVNPRRFLTPGLVYDAGLADWYGFLEGQGIATGTGAKPILASNLNQPSIAIGSLAGKQTVTRRVTALTAGTYRATATLGKAGVTVSPKVLTFTKAGQTKSFKVTITRSKAALAAYSTGFLTWKGPRGLSVRSPIAVRPVAVAAPAEVHGTGTSGSASFKVALGTSPLPLTVKGLTAGIQTPGSVKGNPDSVPTAVPPVSDDFNLVVPLTVPAGTTLLRVETVGAKAGDDLDIYVRDTTGKNFAVAATASSNERVDVLAPAAGSYYVIVNGFATETGTATFTLRTFAVGSTAAGNLAVSPTTLKGTIGSSVPVKVTWSGLAADTPYLGWIGYGTSGQVTKVSIN